MATRAGTGFSTKVFEAVSKIPKGKTATYKQVAAAAGSPKAARAVGNILSKNPNPIIVPCHRVIRSDRSLGGYLGEDKSQKKVELLKKEGVKIKDGKVEKSHFLGRVSRRAVNQVLGA
ncbi:MAG: MGMT family protein [Candidatus Micrarchaeia archaeon]|jgi:O-6-methylguanine DNA methyltransferase